ncbi:R-spondin-2-like [Liolophura sinensis]|uniref:R-spondin-2-like n=1 Tax=Liolophura sinensis TaxID=3198878 RepID=UPI003157F344
MTQHVPTMQICVSLNLIILSWEFLTWTVHVGAVQREKRTIKGFYPLCPRGCSSCSAVNGCVTCQPHYFLLLVRTGMRQRGVCTYTCPAGYYGLHRHAFRKCYKCQTENCEACYSRHYCSRCQAPYVAYQGQCVTSCPDGQHYANHSKDCRPKVDCMVGPWGDWGKCTREGLTCGYKYGEAKRSRDVLENPSPNGNSCPELEQTKRCKLVNRFCVDLLTNKSEAPRYNRRRQKRLNRRKKKLRKLRRKLRKRKRRNRLRKRTRQRKYRKKKTRPLGNPVEDNLVISPEVILARVEKL